MKKSLIVFVFICLFCAFCAVSVSAETDTAPLTETVGATNEIKVAGATDAEAGTYTLADAIAYAKAEGISEYTLKLTENITVESQIKITYFVDMTVDLSGYTLTHTVNMLSLEAGANGAAISFVTSVEGGKLYSSSKTPIQASKKG